MPAERGWDTWNGVDKNEYYPVQASARGGIGQVLAIGAKAGKHLLVATDVGLDGTKTSPLAIGVSGGLDSSFEADDSYFKYAARDWEARDAVRGHCNHCLMNYVTSVVRFAFKGIEASGEEARKWCTFTAMS